MKQIGAVLVTGGAGYIGSHAVLALRKAGYPIVVLDNLSTGFRTAVPDDVTFVEGDIADGAIVAVIFAHHGIVAIMNVDGSVICPESVENPLNYYEKKTARTPPLIAT